jgi:hypothetical protein
MSSQKSLLLSIGRGIFRKGFALVLMLLAMICQPASGVVILDSKALNVLNDLQRIALAMHNYNDATGSLPRDITDSLGNPLLSWRVALLPYLEEQSLFDQFDLTVAWNAAPNAALLDLMPDVLRGPLDSPSSIFAHYVRGSGPNTLLEGINAVRLPQDVPDGTSNTLLVGEFAGSSLPWTAPSDLPIAAPVPALGTPGFFASDVATGAAFAFADGSVHFLSPDNDSDTLYRLFIRNDGNVVNFVTEELVNPVPDAASTGLQLGLGVGLLLALGCHWRICTPLP